MKMLKNRKLQKGKGKRIKLQWQYRLLNIIGEVINFPQSMKRKIKLSLLTNKRQRIQRRIQIESLGIEMIARAKTITLDRFFNQHVYD
jgi:hypothetical protein